MNDHDNDDTIELEAVDGAGLTDDVTIELITELDDRVIVDVIHADDIVDAEVVDEATPAPALRWHQESWRLQEPERLPNHTATVMELHAGGMAYAYIYATSEPPKVIWSGKAFDSLDAAKAAVEAWLLEHAEWSPA